jgi:hypothetical protein
VYRVFSTDELALLLAETAADQAVLPVAAPEKVLPPPDKGAALTLLLSILL